jgi:hypothetical protein
MFYKKILLLEPQNHCYRLYWIARKPPPVNAVAVNALSLSLCLTFELPDER